jgi:DNA-binding response OmpR family regulator
MSHKVLVFTKDKAVSTSLAEGLEKRGFTVSVTGSKKKMAGWAAAGRADFLVVDASNASDKGVELCQHLRASNPDVRIILGLPGRRRRMPMEEMDAILVTPLTVRKVLYRINALLQAKPRNLLCVGEVSLDPKTRIVRCPGRESRLTPKAARLLQVLMQHAGELILRPDIMREVWDTDFTGDMRTIDVHISWIRKAIEPSDGDPHYIQTVRNKGYLFCTGPQSTPNLASK